MTGINNLPEEVIALIGSHLDKKDINAAIRTCRLFHNALRHLLWRHLSFPTKGGQILLSAAEVEKSAYWVHCLSYRYSVPQEYWSIHYPNVYNMRIDYYLNMFPQLQLSTILLENLDRHHCLLIESNPQVQNLTLRNLKIPPSITLWDTVIASLQNPRQLIFHHSSSLPLDSRDSFWRACSLFEDMDLKIRDAYQDILETLTFPRLKRLTLEIRDSYTRSNIGLEDYLVWIKTATQLEALAWHMTRGLQFPTNNFIRELNERRWPRLESVGLTNVTKPDDVWANIIQLLPPLKEFRTNNRLFEEQSFARLQEHHFRTLRSLNVRGCHLFSSRMALSVLTECVHLEDFRAPYLRAADLKNRSSISQDWACVGLKYLKLYIASDPEDPESNELVCKQLSRLQQLKELHFDQWLIFSLPAELKGPLTEQGSLQLRLDAGLAHLSTLKRLTTIYFDETRQRMRFGEVEWILQNWTALEEMSGSLSGDTNTQAELEAMFDGTH
ncbi:hypothetical protein BGW39_011490, partial [Mortierella sp. 14UC]